MNSKPRLHIRYQLNSFLRFYENRVNSIISIVNYKNRQLVYLKIHIVSINNTRIYPRS